METKSFVHKKRWLFLVLFSLLFLLSEVMAQQFPIGTYWVRTDRERYDQYPQVADCGIQIIVGGYYGSSALPNILSAAEAENITLIIDRVTGTDSIQWFAGSHWSDVYRGAQRSEYESDGYQSDGDLARIETPILYEFSHNVGSKILDNQAQRGYAWQASPPIAGMLMHQYTGSAWQFANKNYFATFIMKVDDNSGHVLVATVRIMQGGNTLLEQQIYSDAFPSTATYYDFEFPFTTPAQTNLDYQVEYHSNRTLTVDYVAIENEDGDRLNDGGKDADLLSDVQGAFQQDAGNPTIRGFFIDQPDIFRIVCTRYVNNLIGTIAPARFGFRETIQGSVCDTSVFHQYLNAGAPENRDHKLLANIYPIHDDPAPGQQGYNAQIQYRWDHDLIPALADAYFVATLNSKPFWYAAQVHSWRTYRRNPYPTEIRAMVNLGLAYGAKGIFYFLYTSIPSENAIGLVDVNFNHNYEPYLSKWNEVQQINDNLQYMASDLLSLNWQSAFTSGDAVPDGSVVQSIAGGDYIEIGNFTHQTSGHPYIMLVNRRCEAADTQIISVTTNKTDQAYQIEDKLTGECYVTSDGIFRNISLEPGAGRLFELTPVFDTDETWTYLINISSDITVPAAKVLTITPATTIKFASAAELKINGALNAQGTSANPITFTSANSSPAAGDWQGTVFDHSDNNSTIKHSIIEYASVGVKCDNVAITLQNSTIQYNSGNGIFCYQASPTIYHNTIQNNGIGILCQLDSHPYINDNYIIANSSYGIFCTQTCSPKIRHNEISANNSGGGIACLGGSAPQLIGLSESEAYGANKIVSNNGNGVVAFTNSNPDLGFLIEYPEVAYNDIYNNAAKQVASYTTNKTIYARQNWWGTSNPGSELFYGAVVYSFPLSNPSPYAGPTWNRLGKAIALSASEHINEAEKLIQQGLSAEAAGDYEMAVAAFRSVIDRFGDSEYGVFALDRLLMCRIKQGKITVEQNFLNEIPTSFAECDIATSARLWQPIVEARLGNIQRSLELCDSLAAAFRGTDLARDAMFEKGALQLYEFKNSEAARKIWDDFAVSYPGDPLLELIPVLLENYYQPDIPLPRPLPQRHDQLLIAKSNSLIQNYPNPFNPETEIRFQLREESRVTLSIFNLLGQKVSTLIDEEMAIGFHNTKWDGKDAQGNNLASGIYTAGLKRVALWQAKN